MSEESITDDDYREPVRKAAGAVAGGGEASLDVEARRESEPKPEPASTVNAASADRPLMAEQSNTPRYTLAEQANMLAPGTYKIGPGVFRLGRPKAATPGRPEPASSADIGQEQAPVDVLSETAAKSKPQYNRRASDKALQNLQFIGSGPDIPGDKSEAVPIGDLQTTPQTEPDRQQPSAESTAPAPSLRDPRSKGAHSEHHFTAPAPNVALGNNSVWGLPIEEYVSAKDESPFFKPLSDEAPAESARVAHPAIDMDSTYTTSPPPVLATSDVVLPEEEGEFSNSLMTSDEYDA